MLGQAEQLSKSRKKFLATEYNPFSRSLYKSESSTNVEENLDQSIQSSICMPLWLPRPFTSQQQFSHESHFATLLLFPLSVIKFGAR